MNPEIARHMRAVLDAHDDAFRALRAANQAMALSNQSHDDVLQAVLAANAAMGTAIQAHDDAIKAALSANRAAMGLLDHLTNNGAGA